MTIALQDPSAALSDGGAAVILGECRVNGLMGQCFGAGTTAAEICATLGISGMPSVVIGPEADPNQNPSVNSGCSQSGAGAASFDCSGTTSIVVLSRCAAFNIFG